MNLNDSELMYRKMAVQDASPAGLVVILYDVLVGDLVKAIEAIGTNEICKRSEHIKHALLVLQQLEGSLDMEHGAETAKSLEQFYTYIRSRLMEAHVKTSPQIFQQLIELVLGVREAWQQLDSPSVQAGRFSKPTPAA